MPPSPGGPGRPRRRIWLYWLMVAAGIAAGLGAGLLWRRHALLEQLRARLPAMPDVSAQPAPLATALRETEQRVLSSRRNLEGVGELGRLYHANGYAKEAEACWQILHAQQPQEAHWCYYLADLRRTASDDAGMVSFLEQTVKLAPDYSPAWLNLAE